MKKLRLIIHIVPRGHCHGENDMCLRRKKGIVMDYDMWIECDVFIKKPQKVFYYIYRA